MKNEIPIVFIHKGNSWWLPYVLYQAKFYNKDSRIVLISDINRKFDGIENININDVKCDLSEEFNKVYKHMSFSLYDYEIFCWLRWFYLLEYMKYYKINNVLYLDSDVLLNCSIKNIINIYGSDLFNLAYLIPFQDAKNFRYTASGHTSFWSMNTLENFCEFTLKSYDKSNYINEEYEKKWNFHKENNLPGGICDMTTLYLFWRENKSIILNLAKEKNEYVFDNNINSSDNFKKKEYLLKNGIKKVIFRDSQVFFIKNNNEEVKALSLHLQGLSKALIPKYYSGNSFQGKMFTDIKSTFYSNYYKMLKYKNSLRK